MNVAQNISAIVNSPEIAAMALQAVQAGEMAERSGLANLRREHLKKEMEVSGTEETSFLDGVRPHAEGAPPPPPRRRQGAKSGPPAQAPHEEEPGEAGSGVGDGHRIDVVV